MPLLQRNASKTAWLFSVNRVAFMNWLRNEEKIKSNFEKEIVNEDEIRHRIRKRTALPTEEPTEVPTEEPVPQSQPKRINVLEWCQIF